MFSVNHLICNLNVRILIHSFVFIIASYNFDDDTKLTLTCTLCPGCGIFASKFFSKSEFLLEYRGELISGEEGEERYRTGQTGSFLYFFEVEGRKNMW